MTVLENVLQEIEDINYPSYGIGCGLEDVGITDRYEAAAYGWDEAIERITEIIRSHMSNNDWIPVQKALPEEKENPITMDFYEYEVTFQSDNICDIRHYKFGRGHWWHGGAIVDEYVVAWRKLQEPYRQEE